MTCPVILIRPQPGCDTTVEAARALGLDAHGFPLFAVTPRAWVPPPADAFDALLLGSANALRHAGPALAGYAVKPVYAVGRETADAARAAGLDVAATGSGGLQQVLAACTQDHRKMLRLTGAARVALDPPAGVTIEERVVYASEPVPMAPECATILRGGALVLLHSGEAGRHFTAECTRLSIDRGTIALAALAPRIAEAARDGWAALRVADLPSNPALLALASEMCQIVPGLRGTVKST